MEVRKVKKVAQLGIITTLIVATQFSYAVDLPTIKAEGKTVQEFIPDGWSLMTNGSVKGDLNYDGKADMAAIFEANTPVTLSTAGDAKPVKPRILAILFAKKGGGYTLSTQANHGLLRADEGSHSTGDPIAYMKIRRNALHVGYVGGDADKNHWEVIARFRYKNSDWYMTGYNKSNYTAATSQVVKSDYNAVTGKMRIMTKSLNIDPDADKIKQVTRWEQVEKKQAVKLSSFDPWTVIRLGGGTATADR